MLIVRKFDFKINVMTDKVSVSDLRYIIRNLITFIAVEGKEYVNDQKKQEYVASYIHLLAKIINQVDEDDQDSIVENIAEDISKYIQ